MMWLVGVTKCSAQVNMVLALFFGVDQVELGSFDWILVRKPNSLPTSTTMSCGHGKQEDEFECALVVSP